MRSSNALGSLIRCSGCQRSFCFGWTIASRCDTPRLPHPDREDASSPIQSYDDWLKVKCKAWEGKAQATLTAMQDGNSDFESAGIAYTEILTKLKSALEKQATSLA